MIVKIKTGTLHYMPAKQRGDCFTCYLLASKRKKIFIDICTKFFLDCLFGLDSCVHFHLD